MTPTLIFVFGLLALFQFKHWLCDYRFQTAYMLGKGKAGRDWIKPLAAHAGVHAYATLLCVVIFQIAAFLTFGLLTPAWLMLLPAADFVVHFAVDRLKAAPTLGGRWTPAQPQFWQALGADQAAHHLTHYAFIALLVSLL